MPSRAAPASQRLEPTLGSRRHMSKLFYTHIHIRLCAQTESAHAHKRLLSQATGAIESAADGFPLCSSARLLANILQLRNGARRDYNIAILQLPVANACARKLVRLLAARGAPSASGAQKWAPNGRTGET